MSEVRLIVREAEQDWSGNVHGSLAERAIAALSAEPTTIGELEAAIDRFEKPLPSCRHFANLSRGLRDEPYDAGIVIIDLAARLIVANWTYSYAKSSGEIAYHNGSCATASLIPFHLPSDWLIQEECVSWEGLARCRRADRAENPPFDSRAVLLGPPLLEFLAKEVFTAFDRAKSTFKTAAPNDDVSESVSEIIKNIHIAWLLTPRSDLRGNCPREMLLKARQFIGWDLQDRCHQWTILGERPPGIARDSFAFRYAGFGTHEIVKYYDLVRELLWSCWAQRNDLGKAPIALGDFLTTEVTRLANLRETWLDTPDPECHGRTPRSIIDRERSRLPEAVSGHEAVIDPDCPCCQMMADMPGPVFWHLDGSGMEMEFAFDYYHATREEWEAEQRKWEEWSRRLDAKFAEERRLGLKDPAVMDSEGKSPWRASFAIERGMSEVERLPLGVRLFGIGCHLTELIVDLRGENLSETAPESRHWIDQLHRDFGNLRELLQTPEVAVCASLFDPVIARFSETLATLAVDRPELEPKCESLTSEIHRLLAADASEENDNGNEDWELPF